MEIAVLALGCFWGPEIKFSKIEGIIKTEVGYCGGDSPTTTYKEVCTGKTNHAEVVKLDFDKKTIPKKPLKNKTCPIGKSTDHFTITSIRENAQMDINMYKKPN